MYNYFKIGLIIVTYSTCMSSGKIFDLKMSQLRRGQITLYDVMMTNKGKVCNKIIYKSKILYDPIW